MSQKNNKNSFVKSESNLPSFPYMRLYYFYVHRDDNQLRA